MTPVRTWLGYSYPLGATWMDNGVNFALFSDHATGVELCLFENREATEENIRVPISECTDQVWHVFLPDARPGQLYGFRVAGPYDPEHGLRFNSSKLLLDPYAKAIAGKVSWADEMFGYVIGDKKEDLTQDFRDDAWGVPKSVVIDTQFDWQGDRKPSVPLDSSVIYEMHVKGFSKIWQDLPEELRGTYAGLGSAVAIDYLKKLGVTAIELLPVHAHIDDKVLVDRGLTNYWGYNTIGIDNIAYYRLNPQNPRFYLDFTGTGNTFNLLHPRMLQLVTDSLRYWVEDMHVDGFRFDLASALARNHEGFNKLHPFFQVIQQDPVLSQVKLIAEPWDVGEGGYQVGNFPAPWSEWNGKYRDAVRSFWKGDERRVGEMGYRLTGSPDLYQHDGRRPYASINFVTAHDGFTLNDLVSYNDKHNELNDDGNHDGDNNNLSWNCGVEGPTDDLQINALRERQRRNFLTTLFLSQGVPMLTGGDEWGRTQKGNNNAYCQDNEISWFDWTRDEKQNQFLDFTRKLIWFRKAHPAFRRPKFLRGRRIRGSEIRDVMWFNPGGSEMTDEEWASPFVRCLGMLLSGDTVDVVSFEGEPVRDDTFLLLINAHYEPIPFVLPGQENLEWQLILDTMDPDGFLAQPGKFASGDDVDLGGRACCWLQLVKGAQAQARAESWKKRPVEFPPLSAEEERARHR